jgi:hypothetical protein
MASTTKLTVYNKALLELGGHLLADTTTANPSLHALDAAFDHAVEYTLGRLDWNFARRRDALPGSSYALYPPFTYRYPRPSNYLRKVWIKADADDEFQADHTESGIYFYGFASSVRIEYISDHPDNYTPSYWPPHFTRVVELYLALLVAPKIGRTGSDDVERDLSRKLGAALEEADRHEAVFTTNKQIASERIPVIRRSLEMIGHQLTGGTISQGQSDQLRWAADRTWDEAMSFMLVQAPWNFAIRRASMTGTADTTSFPPYTYRYSRPSGFLQKNWIRSNATDTFEADFAEAGTSFYGYESALKIEYVALDATSQAVANWPPAFLDAFACYLAMQLAGRLTVGVDGNGQQQVEASKIRDSLKEQFASLLSVARSMDATVFMAKQIASERLQVMRRALEFMGQSLSGNGAIDEAVGKLRWAMNQSWDYSIRSCLEAGAWNFATKRAMFTNPEEGQSAIATTEVSGIVEGYSVAPAATSSAAPTDFCGFDYGFPLPDDFLHKIWFKLDAAFADEAPHQIIRDYIFTNAENAVMEYIAEDSWTTDPDNWPATFLDVVAAHLALSVSPELTVEAGPRGGMKVTANQIRDALEANYSRRLRDAKTKDAIQQMPKKMPLGSFARARFGSTAARRF